jgi:uncharacterized protein (DUF305 family)
MRPMRYLYATALIVLVVCSCKKDNMTYTPPTTPSHEDNRMMKEMHQMMSMMDTMNMSGDPDTHFAKMMKMHHKGAINMSKIITSEGKDAFIKSMADKMITEQTKEISELDSFLINHISQAENKEFNMKMETSMMKMHKSADLQYLNGNLDHDFATLMVPHHQSAIEMADLVIHYGHETAIAKMAAKMKEDQEKEIGELQDWLLK